MIFETSDIHVIARFVAPLQEEAFSRSGAVGMDATGIAKEFEEYETTLYADWDDAGELTGAVGFDYDEPLSRGFVYGPWSIADEWDASADRLLERALRDVPAAMRTVDVAFDTANERVAALAARHGFRLVRDHFTMTFEPRGQILEPDPAIREMTDAERDAVAMLHERCFEGTWPSGRQLLELLDKDPDRKIFVQRDGDTLVAYLFGSVDRDTGEAFVDNIGVDETFRGQGAATRLLRHGLAWFFSFDEVQRVELSVREENAAAIKVYEKAGFLRAWTIRQMRLNL